LYTSILYIPDSLIEALEKFIKKSEHAFATIPQLRRDKIATDFILSQLN
jgi:hypothetical protein